LNQVGQKVDSSWLGLGRSSNWVNPGWRSSWVGMGRRSNWAESDL